MSSVPSKNAPREISCFHKTGLNGSCITFADFRASLSMVILGVTAVFTALVGTDQTRCVCGPDGRKNPDYGREMWHFNISAEGCFSCFSTRPHTFHWMNPYKPRLTFRDTRVRAERKPACAKCTVFFFFWVPNQRLKRTFMENSILFLIRFEFKLIHILFKYILRMFSKQNICDF